MPHSIKSSHTRKQGETKWPCILWLLPTLLLVDIYCKGTADICLTFCCCLFKGELKDILLEAQELMVRWQGADPPRKQKWSERQMLLNESWIESRSKIFKFLLQANFAVQEGGICQRCLEEVAMIKCNECSAIKYLCHGCDNSIHDYLPFHDRDAIINGHYVPIAATSSMNNKGEWVIVGN